MKKLLSGNEAIARGAYEAGVDVATGYPGTPSTEILENLVKYDHVYCQWSVNEKVALEVAAGACFSGARCIVTMKHVGLNVAADPLMTLSYLGIKGGLVVAVADDPGMHSSQNEQDTRNYARFAKIPIFEPSDSQEAKDFVRFALEVSEKFDTPVILRSTTRVSHSRSVVDLKDRTPNPNQISFDKNPMKYVPIPVYGRKMRVKVEDRLKDLSLYGNTVSCNYIIKSSDDLGIVTSSIAYQYAAEVFPEASILKLGMSYPFPDYLIREFASSVKKVLVVEELDNFLEEHIRSLGIDAVGREFVPGVGELDLNRVEAAREAFEGKKSQAAPDSDRLASSPPVELPPRPPVLCPGCPHRGIFYTLRKFDVIVTGDIGCYSLGVFPPLERMDTIICMGAGVSASLGIQKAGVNEKIVGVVGDSTFFHSGITGLLDIAYNKGAVTILVLDNRSTAMTGHQDNPGTGKTLMGEETIAASVEDIALACGIRRVRTVDPYDLEELESVFDEEINADEPSLIVSREPCMLIKRKGGLASGLCYQVDRDLCRKCHLCLNLGCPAMELSEENGVQINALLCAGCGLCVQVCRFEAISSQK